MKQLPAHTSLFHSISYRKESLSALGSCRGHPQAKCTEQTGSTSSKERRYSTRVRCTSALGDKQMNTISGPCLEPSVWWGSQLCNHTTKGTLRPSGPYRFKGGCFGVLRHQTEYCPRPPQLPPNDVMQSDIHLKGQVHCHCLGTAK